MKEAEVLIQFDLEKLGDSGLKKLFQIEKLLLDLGVHFDSGAGFGFRDWEWDWSLEGPVKVYFRRYKEEKDS